MASANEIEQQMDIRGSMLGFLASHPLRPVVSLHHWEAMDSIFPEMEPKEAMQHLFQAVNIDSQRILQQTVCYDRWFSWTISLSWGYAVQIFPYHLHLPEALRTLQTYLPWKKRGVGIYELYEVDELGLHPDPCRRPTVFFLHTVSSGTNGIRSTYTQMTSDNCTVDASSPKKLKEIVVLSQKLDLDHKQVLQFSLSWPCHYYKYQKQSGWIRPGQISMHRPVSGPAQNLLSAGLIQYFDTSSYDG